MPQEKAARTGTRQSAKKGAARSTSSKRSQMLTAEERAAMRELVRERKATAARGRAGKADGESDVLAKIAEMQKSDRVMAERFHAIVKSSAPDLSPRTWYGMPAYAKDGKIVCYFRDARKFKERYALLGFNDKANLDEGAMWPVAFALTELTPDVEAKIAALVKKAVS